jgi:sodium-dependent dicarboxylate transporter 2/3/5
MKEEVHFMSMTLLWALICLIIFIAVLAHPKLPNWMTFICLAPVALFSGIMERGDIYAVLNSSSLHLMIIICMFSGMIAATGLDVVIGEFVDRVTSSQTGKKKEMMIFAIVYITSGLVSTVLQNSYVALAFLPVLRSIARKNRISLSKLVLFVIFSTTLGGAVTLIGTPTNVYANTALEEAGLQLFGMLDFAWVAIPIFIIGGIYMVIMNRWCASYDDFGEEMVEKQLTKEQKNKQKVVGVAFLVFVLSLVLGSLKVISIDPNFVGYAMIALAVLSTIVSPKEVLTSLDANMIIFCAGINLMIAVMNQSGLGNLFGEIIISLVGESRNLYVITAIVCIGASIATQFMNNMACAGMLAPVGISIAEALGANPQAIVLAIAIGAGCSYLTPIASGTNQTMMLFTKLKFQDFAKFGWPLLIISWICCVLILPQVFPFF